MGKLLGTLGALVLYLCLGTVLAQCAAVGYLTRAGYLSPHKLIEIDAVLRDFSTTELKAALQVEREAPQPTTEQIARARATAQRDLELREQALRHRADQIKLERAKLAEETARYHHMKTGFEQQLAQLHDATSEASAENARLLLENIKPKQTKDQMMRMIEAGEVEAAVKLFSAMPVAKRAKVSGEFKSEEEGKRLAEILKRIREGDPDLKVIDSAKARATKTS